MQITLDAVAERIIREKVDGGNYHTADEAVNAAVKLLDEAHRRKLDGLRREIAIGVEQADRGELIDGEEVFARLRRRREGGGPT